jgi:flagellar protein FlaG
MPVLPIAERPLASARQAAGEGAAARSPSASRGGGAPPASPGLDEVLAALRERASGALEFIVDGNRTIVRVVDKQTNTVLRQMPAPEMIAVGRALDRMQGILIRLKA